MFNKKVYELTIRAYNEVVEDLNEKSNELCALSMSLGEGDIEEKCCLMAKANYYMEASNFLKRQEIEFIEETNRILEKENAELRKVVKNNEQNG